MASLPMPINARLLVKDCRYMLQIVHGAAVWPQQYRSAVQEAADALISEGTAALLREIPVEEINRERRGYRIKALRDSGCTTMADLWAIPESALAAVNGISDAGAADIKTLTARLADQARAGVKIRLSSDSRTAASTALVAALVRCRLCQEPSAVCKAYAEQYEAPTEKAIADLQPACSRLRWLFSPRADKERAVYSFDWLAGLLDSEYAGRARMALRELQGLRSKKDEDFWADFIRDPIPLFSLLEEICPGMVGADDTVRGLPEGLALQMQQLQFSLDGLRCQLRRYQDWGVRYILCRRRVLLGDEMGLGKTVQAIAAMVALRNEGASHFLVVCPASVLENWCREITRHSDLAAVRIHGASREAALNRWVQEGGVGVTTYETTADLALPENFRLTMLTADEAHYIKNPETQRSKNVRRLSSRADRLLFMTGTALENRVDEMIELISILQPQTAQEVRKMASLSSAPQFREAAAPVYYRRRREEVLTELPDLIETADWCELTGPELDVYEASILSRNFNEARRVSWNAPAAADSSKAQRLLELVDDAREDGRKVIVFSFFLDTLDRVCELLGSRCLPVINGSVPPERRQGIVDLFDAAAPGTVLPAQILAGGTGLNIQSASVVILCEPQLKPSTENQAISRAYRMGQTRNVLVHRLLCQDTVDEWILSILAEKQAAFDAFADRSCAAEDVAELDSSAVADIINAEIARIQARSAPADRS